MRKASASLRLSNCLRCRLSLRVVVIDEPAGTGLAALCLPLALADRGHAYPLSGGGRLAAQREARVAGSCRSLLKISAKLIARAWSCCFLKSGVRMHPEGQPLKSGGRPSQAAASEAAGARLGLDGRGAAGPKAFYSCFSCARDRHPHGPRPRSCFRGSKGARVRSAAKD